MGTAAAITLLGATLPSLIQWAEQKWGGGGTGAEKKAAVSAAAAALAQTAAGAGKAPAISMDDIYAAIEAVLIALKAAGQVPSSVLPSTPVATATYIFTGTLKAA